MNRNRHMKIAVAAAAGALALLPLAAQAQLVELSDADLANVSGQKGFAVNSDFISWDAAIGTVSMGDEDGVNSLDNGANISANNIRFSGSADFGPESSFSLNARRAGGGLQITGLNGEMDSAFMHIDRLEVESLTLGENPGQGESLGSFYMGDMDLSVKGRISISEG